MGGWRGITEKRGEESYELAGIEEGGVGQTRV